MSDANAAPAPNGDAPAPQGDAPAANGAAESAPSDPAAPPRGSLEEWEFPGWGTVQRIDDLDKGPVELHPLDSAPSHKLGEVAATAICGNDITSSCLYVAALCTMQAGIWAPLALLIVAVVLYLFRRVYGEVGTALPLNGGAYNALLNTSTKGKASVAACLTILSYVATAVISAGTAMSYAEKLFPALEASYAGFTGTFWATIGLLGIFAFLNIMGISESAKVAIGIFAFHLVTLSVLLVAAVIFVFQDPSMFKVNWQAPAPNGYGFFQALFFGFAAALLGISGFESSANFIEEQKPGVFIKTLRNMWLAVSFFNPVICVLAIGLLSFTDIADNYKYLLAEMGLRSAGKWLAIMVSIDAVLVLSGAVLTSYVGVTGLVRRMSLDRCMPQFLLQENNWRKTNHWIILGFFAICVSIHFITTGEISVLAGVYTLSFLGVMALFALGNMMLKVKRARLPRAVKAGWPGVTFALIAVCVGIAGNVLLNPEYVRVFGIYITAVAAAVAIMFLRIDILKIALHAFRMLSERVSSLNKHVSGYLKRKINDINSQTVIFFTKGDDLADLNKAAQYVLDNEQTRRLMVLHVHEPGGEPPEQLGESLKVLDRIYPQLRIDFVLVTGEFGPELIERLSDRLEVQKNYMFIGCPGDRFPHKIEDLGGVRLIV